MQHYLQQSEHRQLLEMAVKAVTPHKIYLLGSRQEQQKQENIFSTLAVEEVIKPGHYLWLVLIPQEGENAAVIVQDKIEQLQVAGTSVLAWVMSVNKFAERLAAGDYFASTVYYSSTLCYDSNQKLFQPPKPLQPEHLTQQQYDAYQQRVSSLMEAAGLFITRGQFPLAAFMLHQCTEQALTAIIYGRTGYRPLTHNLEKLYRYAAFVCQYLQQAWPLHTASCIDQLRHLNKAYKETRYSNNYHITESQLHNVTGKVVKLQTLLAA